MLRESGLMDTLRGLMPADGSNGPVHAMHGGLAHPQSIWLFGGCVNPPVGTPEQAFNRFMSGVRVAVEWGFAQIVGQWSHLDFKQNMKIFKSPVAQHCVNCAFLCNLRSCFCGNQTTVHFNADALSLEQHLALVDWTFAATMSIGIGFDCFIWFVGLKTMAPKSELQIVCKHLHSLERSPFDNAAARGLQQTEKVSIMCPCTQVRLHMVVERRRRF